MLGYAAAILLAKSPPPLVDYPDWVYQGVLLRNAVLGHATGYGLHAWPVPNTTTTIGIGLLNLAVSWVWAGKLWVLVYLALAFVASWSLARAAGGSDWRAIVAAPCILFLNLDFWYGHIGFEVGLCLVLLLLALLLRNTSTIWVGALLIATFFTHMESCAGAMLLVGLWYGSRREWRRLACLILPVALTLWYALARGDTVQGIIPDYAYGSRAFLVYKANTFVKEFGYVNARTLNGPSISEAVFGRSLFLVVLLVGLCLAGLVLWTVLWGVLRRGEGDRRQGWAIGGTVLTLIALSVVLPQACLGVSDPGSRLLLMATAMSLFGVRWQGRTATAVAVLSVLMALANLYQFERVERAPLMAGHAMDLPSVELVFGHVEPGTRLGYYDDLERGAMNRYIFSTGIFANRKAESASTEKTNAAR
jgi:hypothetical protein